MREENKKKVSKQYQIVKHRNPQKHQKRNSEINHWMEEVPKRS